MQLRAPAPDEFEAFSAVAHAAFHHVHGEEEAELDRRVWEPERSLAWLDGERMVATTGSFSRRLTVPGAVLPCAAVSMVAVRPTHRRQGLLDAMMRRQLAEVHAGGEAVAALWASEGGIYGRYGYGLATRAATLRTRRPAARLAMAPAAVPGLFLDAGPAGEAGRPDAMRSVHARVAPTWPGMLDRSDVWWDACLFDPEYERDGAQPLQAVLAEDGYALYAVKPERTGAAPAAEVRLHELVAATPEARGRLWGYLLDLDLTTTLMWWLAPADEPLWLELTDPQAVETTLSEALWVRLVDVGAALAARSYATADLDVVLEVADDVCHWNAGRWRLTGDACERTDAAPDLALDVRDLGAAYLGGVPLATLATAGRVNERTPGALARAAAAFATLREPWCPDMF